MAISPAQKLAKTKYQQDKRTLVAADVPKDKGDFYRTSARELNLSLSMLIQNGVEEYIRNHAPQAARQALQATLEPTRDTLTVDEKTALNNLNRLPVKVQKAVLKLIAEIGDSQPKGGD